MSQQESGMPPHADDGQMGDDFARVYENTAHRITVPVALAALDLVGPIGGERRILNIAAGAGALSLPAAERGDSVTSIDIAPGMVRRLKEKLAVFAGSSVREMDGQALNLPDESFDATFSVFGTFLFTDWLAGLREQARVTKVGGSGCVVTWHRPPGGGPFQILAAALSSVFSDRPLPPAPEGFLALSDPDRLTAEMERAGFNNVVVTKIEGVWEGPVGDDYLRQVGELNQYIPAYAALNAETRDRVDEAMKAFTLANGHGGTVRIVSPVLVAVGRRA